METTKQLIDDIRLTCDNIRKIGDYEFAKTLGHLADQWEEIYVNSDTSDTVVSDEIILKAYSEINTGGTSFYDFTAGFEAGVSHYQSEKAELVEMLELLVDRLEENGLGELNAVNRAKQLLTKIK